MMRPIFGLVLTGMLTITTAAQAQTKQIPRVGYLTGSPLASQKQRNDAFRDALRELGYVDGKNIVIEWRSYEGDVERRRVYANELVRSNVDVIVAIGSGDVQAAKEATTTIPIVMMTPGDPVASGFVASLAQPGGNITGLATLRPELGGKRMEILKDMVPKLAKLAVILSAGNEDFKAERKEFELAAKGLGVKLRLFEVKNPNDIDGVFQTAGREKADAVMFRVAGPLATQRRPQIVALAAKHRLPAMYETAQFVNIGGLASYGDSAIERARRAAVFVDKILKGRKPADLPVEQPMRFEFIINLKAAKQIGLTIPPNVLVRADRVIR